MRELLIIILILFARWKILKTQEKVNSIIQEINKKIREYERYSDEIFNNSWEKSEKPTDWQIHNIENICICGVELIRLYKEIQSFHPLLRGEVDKNSVIQLKDELSDLKKFLKNNTTIESVTKAVA